MICYELNLEVRFNIPKKYSYFLKTFSDLFYWLRMKFL